MKKILMMVAAAIMVALSAQAQKIQVVDDDGNGIPLVSVLTEDGLFIGATDLNGVLADVKGASKVTLTHVAFKPQLVTIADLPSSVGNEGGRKITMEDIDYGLDEVVVKPKPYFYTEYYFRAFSYIDDSLRVYTAGIIPVAHEIRDKYKGKTKGVWTFGGAANKALAWNTMDLADRAEQCAKSNASSIEKSIREGKRYTDYYKLSVEPGGENRWIIRNPEEVLGQILHDDGLSITTIDGGRSQIYANKVNGEDKKAKAREERDYTYQYTEVFKLNEEGNVQHDGFVMEEDHWEYNAKKGRKILIIQIYATEKSYMDEDEFKAHRKELTKGYAGDMSLDELAAYARAHKIPELAPQQLDAIKALTKQTTNKKDKK